MIVAIDLTQSEMHDFLTKRGYHLAIKEVSDFYHTTHSELKEYTRDQLQALIDGKWVAATDAVTIELKQIINR